MRLPTPPAKSTKLTLPCSSDACTQPWIALVIQFTPKCGNLWLSRPLRKKKSRCDHCRAEGGRAGSLLY